MQRNITVRHASAALALLLGAAAAASGAVTKVERISISSTGERGSSESGSPSLSADGRFVAFVSGAANLVPGKTNTNADIFVRDRTAGTTERVSVSSSGEPANDASSSPSISGDGRYVAFQSDAGNLVSGDTNGKSDVFVRDRLAGRTERVSISSAGVEGNGESFAPSISADGRYVAFVSAVSNLVAGDTNGVADVFVRDRVQGTTERVSVSSSDAEANGSSSDAFRYRAVPSISADGRFVAFVSVADNLVADKSTRRADIFVRDRAAGTTERVSVSSSGKASVIGGSFYPSISADGRYVAFESDGADLVGGDIGSRTAHIYVRDRTAGITERVSVSSAGVPGNDHCDSCSVSAEGRYVAFQSRATNFAPGDFAAVPKIYVRDRTAGSTELVSVSYFASSGVQGIADGFTPSISADGRFVAFLAGGVQLDPSESGLFRDIYVTERADGAPPNRVAVFRPSTREWFIRAGDGAAAVIPFGGPGDQPVPADYLAVGAAQIAVFRPQTQEWFIRRGDGGTVGPIPFGRPQDVPVQADYLGLRYAQLAVFRPATREWLIRTVTGSTAGPFSFGGPGDKPFPADYLGEGHAQIAVFRPPTREWFIRKEDGTTVGPIQFGGPQDVPAPGDYLGLRHAQIAVFRPPTAEWFIRGDDGQTTRIQFGSQADVPVPGDYTGSGKTQIAGYRPRTGEWLFRDERGGMSVVPWGGPGDQPVPSPFPHP